MEYQTLRLYLDSIPEQTVKDAKEMAKANNQTLEEIVAKLIVEWVAYCRRHA